MCETISTPEFFKPSFKETNQTVAKCNILQCFRLCFEKALKKIQRQILHVGCNFAPIHYYLDLD